ncbi:hypothetical protein ACQ86D_26930 [Streptomyces galilaeus]
MSRLRRHLMSGAGVASALTGLLLYAASPASAAVSSYGVDTSEYGKYLYQAGSEDFYTYGDWFNICDNSPDGAGVIGYWKVGASGSEQSKYSGGGYDTCVTSDQDFVESSTIYIKVCISDDGVVIKGTCSSWLKAYADGVA